MKISIDKVFDGIVSYINTEYSPKMNDAQDLAVKLALGRVYQKRNALKQIITSNGYIKALGLCDENGEVEITEISQQIKDIVKQKGSVKFHIPLLGNFTIEEQDIQELYALITGGQHENN